jgi:hypothetical protein
LAARGWNLREGWPRVFDEEIFMTALVQTMFRTVHSVREVHPLKQLLMFCAAGLFVGLLMLTYGLDLSPGFF